jgi:hypothetical protein
MSNKEHIHELLAYFQATEEKTLQFDEEAIVAAYQKSDNHQSLAIKVLSVFGGLLASLAFLGFLFIAGLYDSKVGLLVFGALFIAGSIWVSKQYDRILIDTTSVSTFIIGFFLAGFGLMQLEVSENTICAVFILIALVSLGIVQSYILSFVAVLIVNGSILTLIFSNKAHDLIHVYLSVLALAITYLFLNEAKIIRAGTALSKLYNPVRTGLIFSFLLALIIVVKGWVFLSLPQYIWLPSVVMIACILYLLFYLFKVLGINKVQNQAGILIFSLLLLLPTALSPAISGAILIILLSFLVNYKTGLVIGIVAFLYFIAQYYYDLHFTLFTKSILMFASGVLFLSLYWFTHKKLA